MKKLATSGLKSRLWSILTASLFIASQIDLQGQGCVMSCPPNDPPLEVSLPPSCIDTLTYGELGVTIMDCPGLIEIDIIENGLSIGDTITSDMIGNTYMVIISHPASGQSCMMMITVVDQQAPVVNCPSDVTLECTADLSTYNDLSPGDISDCSATNVTYDDELLFSGNCSGSIISQYLRTYIIADIYNNADTCQQLISLEAASLANVEFPPDITGVNALDCFPLPDTSASNTGFPSVGGNPIVNGTFCNLSAIKSDQILQLCSGSYTIFRTWTVYDWCNNNAFIDSTQIIEVVDRTAPVVQAPPDMTVSAGQTICEADVLLPPALVTEDCPGVVTVRTQGPFGTIQSNGGMVSGLPVGTHTIVYIAMNECDSTGTDTMILTVEDLQPPVPVCHQYLAIPLNGEGNALIPAAAFNAASQDNCGPVYFKVKRMSLPVGYSCPNPGNPNNMFDDFIQFCCEDIPNNEIMVILRVYDIAPVAGPVSDSYLAGNFNDCMVQVEVQDKLPPSITCPSDLTISCEFPFTMENLDVFGSVALSPGDQQQICIDDPGFPGDPGLQCLGIDGLAIDNCNVAITTSASLDINACGTGTLIRTFTATDDGGLQATCQQTITIINYDLFDLSDIIWPSDFTTSNICDIDLLDPDDLLPPFNEPVLNEGPCSMVAATYEDDVFDFTNQDQACFKILRTWTVMDWCQLNTETVGVWTHIQVIKVMNTVAPLIDPVADITECSFDPECEGLELEFTASATDDCSSAASLTWRYSIDIGNNLTFDFISPLITGSSIEFTADLPIGSHRILYSVTDQCGNTTVEEQNVTVQSCKAPSAKCIHGLSTNLMAMDLDGDGTADWGMVTLQAEMFDAGSDHPCGNEVTVSFSSDPLDNTRVFDCNDLGENEIELWAIDENGLTDFCITTVDIQDNNNICPPDQGGLGTISGNLNVPGSGKLAGAMIYLDGSNQSGIQTGSNGYFVFPSMPFGGQYDVRPTREGDDKNGVSTIDLVLIQKHLLGIKPFETPYQYIAADANNSKSITAIDIIQLRKLILGYYNELPDNTSWRFVESGHIFPDQFNPWTSEWPETYHISSFSSSMNDVNFESVKIGDVNLSANLQMGSLPITIRSDQKSRLIYYIEQENESGHIKVQLKASEALSLQAIQFSLGLNIAMYDIIDWQPGTDITSDEVRMPDEHNNNISVAADWTESLDKSELDLLTLWVKPRHPGAGKFSLYLQNKPTEPAAYKEGVDLPLKIELTPHLSTPSMVSNRPNPFKEVTTVQYTSHRSEICDLNFYNTSGTLVLTKKISLVEGSNELYVYRNDLPAPGIYVYEIKSPFQHSTNRMIIVD